jgi:hypothetical protein
LLALLDVVASPADSLGMPRSLVAMLYLATALGCSGEDQAEGKTNSAKAAPIPAAKTGDGGAVPQPEIRPAPPTYSDTVQGLESLMRSLVSAIQNDDTSEVARLLESMRLEDPKSWFGEVFEARLAERLVAEYEPLKGGIGHLVNALKGPIDAGQTDVKADRFESPDMQGATGYQQVALARMKKKVPLYSVRLSTRDGKRTFHVWSFIHHQGTFRLAGKMRAIEEKPPELVGGRDPLEYREIDRERVKSAGNGK